MKTLGLILGGMLLLAVGTAHAADLQKGEAAYARGDYAAAIAEFGPLAERGDAVAQFRLGSMYDFGKGAFCFTLNLHPLEVPARDDRPLRALAFHACFLCGCLPVFID